MTNSNVILLDCTFRDGGYYTNWNFDEDLVNIYYSAIIETDVDIMEAGYISVDASDCGRFKVENISGFNFLSVIPGKSWAAMIDSKSILCLENWHDIVIHILKKPARPVIDIIRVATKFNQLDNIDQLCNIISASGYRVALNLMQIDLACEEEVTAVFEKISSIKSIETVYLADSFGSMPPQRVAELITRLKEITSANIGFHAHNNMGMALINSMTAIQAGANWIDTTFAGMGRGAGNAATEELSELIKKPGTETPAVDVLLKRHMDKLKTTYNWGGGVLYRRAGKKKIHPTYVQFLIDADLPVDKVYTLLEKIPAASRSIFNTTLIKALINEY
ncbi:conserved uncharacterized protein [Erwinia pyrifoliae Ep1/96]|nr:conserved uncharacterized protein [Erwinia pyrifoliae Ep1/96]